MRPSGEEQPLLPRGQSLATRSGNSDSGGGGVALGQHPAKPAAKVVYKRKHLVGPQLLAGIACVVITLLVIVLIVVRRGRRQGCGNLQTRGLLLLLTPSSRGS